jgi:hypothetical protein
MPTPQDSRRGGLSKPRWSFGRTDAGSQVSRQSGRKSVLRGFDASACFRPLLQLGDFFCDGRVFCGLLVFMALTPARRLRTSTEAVN